MNVRHWFKELISPLDRITERSARLRLTMSFTAMLLVVGTCLVLSIYLAMSIIPDYQITAITTAPETDATTTHSSPVAPEPALPSGVLPVPDLFDDTSGQPDTTHYGVTVRSASDILRVLLTTSIIVFALVLIGGIWFSWIVAGRVLRPIDALRKAALDAEHGDVKSRISLTGPRDEFHHLAKTFNDMLDRLDKSYQAQRRFASNASHELRTPLATTQAMLDVAITTGDSTDMTVLIPRLRETNTRSIETINALLALADAEAGEPKQLPVRVDDLVKSAVKTIRRKAITLELRTSTAPLTVMGDPSLLASLVQNLLDNAFKHNQPGGWITIETGKSYLRVSNSCAAISTTETSRLIEPFYRTAGRVAGSHGIGLTLCEAIMAGHGGALHLEALLEGGLEVTASFTASSI